MGAVHRIKRVCTTGRFGCSVALVWRNAHIYFPRLLVRFTQYLLFGIYFAFVQRSSWFSEILKRTTLPAPNNNLYILSWSFTHNVWERARKVPHVYKKWRTHFRWLLLMVTQVTSLCLSTVRRRLEQKQRCWGKKVYWKHASRLQALSLVLFLLLQGVLQQVVLPDACPPLVPCPPLA